MDPRHPAQEDEPTPRYLIPDYTIPCMVPRDGASGVATSMGSIVAEEEDV